MLSLIRQVSREYGIDVMLSSHLLEEVERICDHIVALDAGQLVAQGRLEDLIGDEQGVVLELAEIADQPRAFNDVVSQLSESGLDVRHGEVESRIEVIGPDADLVADLVRDAVADANARVIRIERRRRRLEDLFSLGTR